MLIRIQVEPILRRQEANAVRRGESEEVESLFQNLDAVEG